VTSHRTDHALSFPVNLKTRQVKTLSGLGLPATITRNRPNQVKVILNLACEQMLSINVGCVHQMFPWQQGLEPPELHE
jgi:hypothetical protein